MICYLFDGIVSKLERARHCATIRCPLSASLPRPTYSYSVHSAEIAAQCSELIYTMHLSVLAVKSGIRRNGWHLHASPPPRLLGSGTVA